MFSSPPRTRKFCLTLVILLIMLLIKQTKHPVNINVKYEKQVCLPKGIILVTARKKCDLGEFISLLGETEKI